MWYIVLACGTGTKKFKELIAYILSGQFNLYCIMWHIDLEIDGGKWLVPMRRKLIDGHVLPCHGRHYRIIWC
jgi:hypothetical protein